jgi:hypothetical protein
MSIKRAFPYGGNILDAARIMSEEYFTRKETLIGVAYKAIVLRIEEDYVSPGNWVDTSLDIDGQTLVAIKARIIEPSNIHLAIPEPNTLGDKDDQLIDLHPTFIAKDINIPIPVLGSTVYVDFEDRELLTGPVFVGVVDQRIVYNGELNTSSKNVYQSNSNTVGIVNQGIPRILPDGDASSQTIIIDDAYYDIGINVHQTEIKLDSRKRTKDIKYIILHWDGAKSAKSGIGVLKRKNISTHFFVDNDGSIIQCLDPAKEVGFHAGKFNPRGIGIDISNAVFPKYQDWYVKNGFGERPTVRDLRINGSKHEEFLGFYPRQVEAVSVLVTMLCDYFGIPKQTPQIQDKVFSEITPDFNSWSGVVAHYHVKPVKWDVASFPLDSLFA